MELRGKSGVDLTPGEWEYSLASVPGEFDVEVDDVGSVRERLVRVAWGESPVMLFLRPRVRKANASRTGPWGGWRGGLGSLGEGCDAADGCID
jgi:hypothetical protein